MLKLDLSNKVALITGGSKGIGKEICLKLAQAGADIVLIHYDNNDENANRTKTEIDALGVKCIVYRLNVANENEVQKMVKEVKEIFEHIDILVNNAGIGINGTIEELTYSQIDTVLNVNLRGPFTMCKEIIPLMVENHFGRIINIASTSMYTGGGGGPHYAASKSGLMGMMRNFSKVYGKDNITTNNLAISLIDTELFRSRYPDPAQREKAISGVPVGRAGTPEDVAYAVCFLASDWASYINGEILQIDGGRLWV